MTAGHSGKPEIVAATGQDREWCAQLMISNEPWITLGVGIDKARESLARTQVKLFIARRGGERLGFVFLDPFGLAGAPYLKTIGVAENARGMGIGSELLKFAEEYFAGRRHLFLCVSDFNNRAQHLYRRMGYEFVAELKDHVADGHSELLLRKRLSCIPRFKPTPP